MPAMNDAMNARQLAQRFRVGKQCLNGYVPKPRFPLFVKLKTTHQIVRHLWRYLNLHARMR